MSPVAEKAAVLVNQGRVVPVPDAQAFAVAGDRGDYIVVVSPAGAWCSCPASPACSHVRAAMATAASAPSALGMLDTLAAEVIRLASTDIDPDWPSTDHLRVAHDARALCAERLAVTA